MLPLSTPIATLKMIGPAFSLRLKKLAIETIGDLLYHIPFRYKDFSIVSKINLLQAGEKVTIAGEIASIGNVFTRQGKKIQKAVFRDETGEIEVVWYNQPYLIKFLHPGIKLTIAGEAKWFGHKLLFESPDYEIIKALDPKGVATQHPRGGPTSSAVAFTSSGEGRMDSPGMVSTTNLVHTGRLVPIYPETAGISSKWLRSRIDPLLHKFYPQINEFLPISLRQHFKLIGEKEAIYKAHFPKTYHEAESARRRLAFDELLLLQLAAKIRRGQWQKETAGHQFRIRQYKSQIQQYINRLPFVLTTAQRKATGDILTDLALQRPMNRLLEGDVGSGKTVVAAIAMYAGFLNSYQVAFMAPTEILALQHFETICRFLEPYGVKIALLTGNSKQESNDFDIFVGTHALLQKKVSFSKLGLIVIDEQQRFGVEQRAKLREKGANPHLLSMTATPIPRTIALTLYADLDLSILAEMPKGRMKVKTWVVPPEKRQSAYDWIRKQIKTSEIKQQAFIICPLIEESETLTTIKAAKIEYQRLRKEIFPDLRVALLHGKLKSKEKEKIMEGYKKGLIDVLVATPVVEVGIDVPTATIIMIEAAERFGLAQLHQLRGRVGRGNQQSYCLLFTESNNPDAITRLKLLETTFNGPKLAEFDLKMRGAGEIFGTKQHGHINLKIADISDLSLVEETKKAANFLLASPGKLSNFHLLRQKLEKYTIEKIVPD